MIRRPPVQLLFVPGKILGIVPALFLLIKAVDRLVSTPLALMIHVLFVIAAITFLALYGMWRCAAMYPGTNRAYGTWLAQTPWRPGKSLPLGPVHVSGQDIFVVAMVQLFLVADWWTFRSEILSLLSIDLRAYVWLAAAWLALAFSVGFAVRATIALVAIRQWTEPVLIAATIPLGFHFAGRPSILVAIAVLLGVLSSIGLIRSLQSFPWPLTKPLLPKTQWLGWPVESLAPVDLPGFPGGLGVAAAALVAWWAYPIAGFINDLPGKHGRFDAHSVPVFTAIFGFAVAAVRCVFYLKGRRAPISFFARPWLHRWIFPSYDAVVFLVPAVTVGLGLILPELLLSMGWSPALSMAAGFAAITAFSWEAGPSYRRWVLTGEYRNVPVVLPSTSKDVTRSLFTDMKMVKGAR